MPVIALSIACQRACRTGSPLVSSSRAHSPVLSMTVWTLYSHVRTLRPPTALFLTVTPGPNSVGNGAPQPMGHGLLPFATVESPAIHTVTPGGAPPAPPRPAVPPAAPPRPPLP